MNEEQQKMLNALIKNCDKNMASSEDDFEEMMWDNMKDGLLFIKNGGK